MGSTIGHKIDYNRVGGTYPAKTKPSSPPLRVRKEGTESLIYAYGNKSYINLALLRAIKY